MSRLKLDSQNVGYSPDEIQKAGSQVFSYINSLKEVASQEDYSGPESFVILPHDEDLVDTVEDLVKKVTDPKLAGAIVFGVGGSSLGTQACYSALELDRKLIFSETVDPAKLEDIQEILINTYKEDQYFIFILVSESGITLETVASFGTLVETLSDLDPDWENHVVAISEPNSPLEKYAAKSKFHFLPIPTALVGRFSVFSPVGLFPLRLVGANIKELLKGAEDVNKLCLETNSESNLAVVSAAGLYLNWREGRGIHNTFLPTERLESFGEWYRQLVGESLGKEGRGVTPIISIAPQDFHSVAQLYLAGPKDKVTTFVEVTDLGVDFTISDDFNLDELVDEIEGKSSSQILEALLAGVKESYQKEWLPYLDLTLENLSEESLGALLQFKMLETVYLARLLEVDPFIQPAVESYKKGIKM